MSPEFGKTLFAFHTNENIFKKPLRRSSAEDIFISTFFVR
jgi:hypothetical protein